jgi:hypothetical protein
LTSVQVSNGKIQKDQDGNPTKDENGKPHPPVPDFHFESLYGSQCTGSGQWYQIRGGSPVEESDGKGDSPDGKGDGYKECGKLCLKKGTDAD